jgi:ABC-type spermidine/putrescine transport system permease subunit I
VGGVEERSKDSVRRRETAISLSVFGGLVLLFLTPVGALGWEIISDPHVENTSGTAFVLFRSQIGNTFALAAASASFATLLGSLVACYAVFSSGSRQRTISVIMAVPLLIGFVARNYAWLGLLQSLQAFGAVGGLLLYSRLGIVVVMGTVMLPFAYFTSLQGVRTVQRMHLESALTLGVPKERLPIVVVLPIALRGILVGLVLTMVLAAGYFITPRMIGGGHSDFVSNGVLTLRDQLGDMTGAAQMAFGLMLAVLPVAGLIIVVTIIRRHRVTVAP